MHAQDGLTALFIRQVYRDLAVKTAASEQSRVKHVRAVGRRDDDDALVLAHAIHLDEQLVQRLLTLIVSAAHAGAALAADRIDLIDEDDARRSLLCLLEHVAHTA